MKTLGIVLLSFFLFIFLSVFGLAFWVQQIALSPGFITGIVKDIDFSETTREVMEQDELDIGDTISPELLDAIVDTIDNVEPVLKENINIAVRDSYDFMFGKANAPSLQEVLGNSFMNAQFVDSVLQKINIAEIVRETVEEQTSSDDELDDINELLLEPLEKLEPTIKTKVVAAADPIFKYILRETQTIDLKSVIRQDVIDKELITEIINSIDITTLIKDMLDEQLEMELPQGIALSSDEIDQTITAAIPDIKSGLISSADSVADFITGVRSDLNITILWKSSLVTTKPIVKQAFLRQLPAELEGASQTQIDQAFEVYWASAQSDIPTGFEIDTTTLGEDVPQSIEDLFTEAQDGLTEARDALDEANISIQDALDEVRPYINIFWIIFWGLLGLILIIIAGIVLIHRSVKDATRDLGINFIVYGALNLAGVLIARFTVGRPAFIMGFVEYDMPETVSNLTSIFVQRLIQPIFIFTLICLIIGIILLVFSFVYPRIKPSGTAVDSLPQST